MGTAERREREKAEVRTKILDAARELFVSEGYEAVSMRKVAQKIEYSPTAIYSYFKDKESLLRELCESDFMTLALEFQHLIAMDDPIQRLRAGARAYVDFAHRFPNHYRLMFMTPLPVQKHGDEALQRRGNPEVDAYAFLRVGVMLAMEAGRLRPDLQDTDLVAQTLWAGIHGVMSLHIAKCSTDDWVDWRPLEDRVEQMVDALMTGLARPDSR
jgi:AcrR family transcriptional regulator